MKYKVKSEYVMGQYILKQKCKVVFCFLVIYAAFVYMMPLNAEESPLNDSYFIGETPGSAAIGRGNAYTAVASSPFASYWNPAALVKNADNIFAVSMDMFTKTSLDSDVIEETLPLEGRKLNYIGVCGPQIGFYWRPLSNRVDSSSGTLAGVNFEETIDEKINVYGITIAVPNSNIVDFGMNINLLTGMIGYSRIANNVPEVVISDGMGWGLDWGLIYRVSEGLNVGAVLMNGPAYMYWDEYDRYQLPPILRAGVDMQLSNLMSLGVDYEKGYYDDSLDDSEIIHVGIEQYVKKAVIMRAGIYGKDLNDKYNTTYTAGIGYRKNGYNIDIAMKQYYLNKDKGSEIKRFILSCYILF
jgi:hypothetical protein